MHNLLKRRFSNKHSRGSSCGMCKPQKRHWADQRKLSDVKADIRTLQQFQEL